jgi:hypothetical protein
MEKLGFILALVVSVSCFGQNDFKLGDYTKLINKNIEFKFKKPLDPFQKEEESYALLGNSYLVSAFYLWTSDNVVALQIYATYIPPQYQNFDWKLIINSEQQSKKFLSSFLGAANNTAMKISEYRVKTINGKVFLEIQSTLTTLGVTQKQINWITVYKNTFVNILGATLLKNFDNNLFLFTEFSNSLIIN